MKPLVALALVAVLAMPLSGQDRAAAPQAYHPEQQVSGTIRTWGNDRMQALMARWEAGFRKHQVAVRFETRLQGTGTAIAGLYTGVADLALMGRSASSTEIMAFEWVFQYKPLGLQVSTGSLAAPGRTFAPVVFVHKDNPLQHLTLAQLDAVFGCEHLRSAKSAHTWGDLGLSGEWATTPIQPFSPDIQSATASFFREAVLKGSYKWNCEMTELADVRTPDGAVVEGQQRVLDALARNRAGIAYSALGYRNAQVKPVALAADDGEPYYAATVENARLRKYPLTRATWVFVNRRPGHPLDPKIREFLRYVLSSEGQHDVARGGDYLPLTSDVAMAQIRQLQ